MNYNLGYACINMALSYPEKGKERITTNRGMIKRTFQQKGLPYASALTLQNAKDLLQILQWNEQHGGHQQPPVHNPHQTYLRAGAIVSLAGQKASHKKGGTPAGPPPSFFGVVPDETSTYVIADMEPQNSAVNNLFIKKTMFCPR